MGLEIRNPSIEESDSESVDEADREQSVFRPSFHFLWFFLCHFLGRIAERSSPEVIDSRFIPPSLHFFCGLI